MTTVHPGIAPTDAAPAPMHAPASHRSAVVQAVANLASAAAAKQTAQKKSALTVYRALLSRAANPSPDDAELLISIMETLGIGIDDFEADAAAVAELAKAESQIVLPATIQAAHEAMELAAANLTAARLAVDAAEHDYHLAAAHRRRLGSDDTDARRKAWAIRAAHPRAFSE